MGLIPSFRQLFFVVLVMSVSIKLSAQTYSVSPIPYTPYPYSGGAEFTVPDDAFSTVTPIGFTFNFFGNDYTKLIISSNGFVSFDTTSASAYSPWLISNSLPHPADPLNAIMAPWQDIYDVASGHIYSATYGVAPNRVFVVSYDSISMFSCTFLYFTGQIVLHETSNAIDIYIAHKDLCVTWNSGRAIEGIQNSDATLFYEVPGRNDVYSTWTADNDAWQFNPCTLASGTDTITGRVYVDLNNNCIFDGTDFGLEHELVLADGGCTMAYTDASGMYSMVVGTDDYTITRVSSGYTATECPATGYYDVSFTASGMTQSGIDFSDTLSGACTDVSLNVGTWTMRKCGDNDYTAYYCNAGVLTTTAMHLDITLPDSLYITSSDTPPSSITGSTYTFDLPPLAPNECASFHFTDSVDCDVELGAYKCITAAIYGSVDCDVSNNSALDCHSVIYSWDPNFISVAKDHLHYVTGEQIGNTDSLTYQINFQNTGTAPAYDIIVVDTLPAYLDAATVVTEISSNTYSFSISGNVLTWTFNGINLPDSTSNELMSHGFVRFKVKQMPGNLPGTIIPGTAAIYFDLNPPVFTNTAADTLTDLAVTHAIRNSDVILYPNPASASVHLEYKGMASQISVQVYNELGTMIQSSVLPAAGKDFDTRSWARGVYLIRLNADGASLTRSLVIE